MRRSYDDAFFDWVALTAGRSARRIVPILRDLVSCESICDIGCGEGVWLRAWSENGVADVNGFDGNYVNRARLKIAPERFRAVDLNASLSLSSARRFDLAQSLEVAEHLSPARAESFVADLCKLADVVVFSAAQPGQGGDKHLNERRVSFWAQRFAEHGYSAFDCVRPRLLDAHDVDPWYRFNTVVYASAAGESRLSADARAMRCADLARLDAAGDLGWRLRRALIKPLPVWAATALSQLRYRAVCALRAS